MEIERKWFIPSADMASIEALVGEINPKEVVAYYVQQFYTSFNPEVRFARSMNSDGTVRYTRITVKGEGKLSRFEQVFDCPDATYNHLIINTPPNRIISKSYCKMPIVQNEEVMLLEVSTVDRAFSYAEIEFETEEDAHKFVQPANWIEVTTFDCFKMKEYARNKRLYLARRSGLLFLYALKNKIQNILSRRS